jgi:hypothetical protein
MCNILIMNMVILAVTQEVAGSSPVRSAEKAHFFNDLGFFVAYGLGSAVQTDVVSS